MVENLTNQLRSHWRGSCGRQKNLEIVRRSAPKVLNNLDCSTQKAPIALDSEITIDAGLGDLPFNLNI